jgi:hypothetical protein
MAFDEGPPVVVYRDERGRYWIVIGRFRHRLRGLPTIRDAPTTSLQAIPVAAGKRSIRTNGRERFSLRTWGDKWIRGYLNVGHARAKARRRKKISS